MGVKISIDKHVSELDDILEMSPTYLSRVQFESKVGPDVTQHLKVRNFDNSEFQKTIYELVSDKHGLQTILYIISNIFFRKS
jgi:hypothetical protein